MYPAIYVAASLSWHSWRNYT